MKRVSYMIIRIASGFCTRCSVLQQRSICASESHVQKCRFFLRITKSTSIRQRATHSLSNIDKLNDGNNVDVVKPFEDIPGPTGIYSWPYLGLLLQMKPFTNYTIDQFSSRIEGWVSQYGPICKQRLGSEWFVYLTDPDDIEKVFREDRKYPYRGPLPLMKVYDKRRKKQPGLFSLNEEDWFVLRSPAQKSMLRTKQLAKYIPVISDIADEFVLKFENKTCINDIVHHFMEFTTEGVGKLCFDERLGCITRSDTGVRTTTMVHVETMLDCFGSQFFVFPWYTWFRTPFYKRFESSTDYLHNKIHYYILKKLKRINDPGQLNADPSLLSDLMSDSRMTPAMIQTTLIDVFIGGIDSTANTLTFLFFLLAKYPEKQEKLYQEILSNMDESGKMDEHTLGNLTYLKACVKETFRVFYPVAAGTTRALDKDIIIKGFRIPARTQVHLCSGLTCKREKYFKDADRFQPERWIRDQNNRSNISSFAHLPFGFGPRKCIGQGFAELEIYICSAKMLKHFRFKLPPGVDDIPYRYKTFATPTNPVSFLIERR